MSTQPDKFAELDGIIDLALKHGLAVGKTYRGRLIYTEPGGQIFILSEFGLRHDFIDTAEAEAFVDATYAMAGSLLGALA